MKQVILCHLLKVAKIFSVISESWNELVNHMEGL